MARQRKVENDYRCRNSLGFWRVRTVSLWIRGCISETHEWLARCPSLRCGDTIDISADREPYKFAAHGVLIKGY